MFPVTFEPETSLENSLAVPGRAVSVTAGATDPVPSLHLAPLLGKGYASVPIESKP